MESPQVRHQEVRTFIEGQYPGYYVTEIREYARTDYRMMMDGKPGLAHMSDEFKVEARHNNPMQPSLDCTVVLLDDGTLRVADVRYVLGG